MLPPSSIISRLAHAKRFDTAFATARSLDVDMSDVFAYLTDQCLKLARNPDAVMYVTSRAVLDLVYLTFSLQAGGHV